MSMKNSNDTTGNRTRDLPTCIAVPQPTALPHAPSLVNRSLILKCKANFISLKYKILWCYHVSQSNSVSFFNFEAWSQNFKKRLLSLSCLSVHTHGTTRPPLEGFSLNLIFKYLPKICRENSSFIKIWQEWRVLYSQTHVYIYIYVTISRWILLRMRNISNKTCRGNYSKHWMFRNLFPNIVPLML
jgi:hypothetical protein